MVPDIKIKFSLDGNEQTLDYRRVPFVAWRELKAAVSFTPLTLVQEMARGDLDAIGAVIWLNRKQTARKLQFAEVQRDLADVGEFELVDLIVKGQSQATGEKDEDEPDPTDGS